MDFDEVVVKESPGLCRCCLSEGCYKDLGTEYQWMGENEVYADMLLECFDIGISQQMEGPNGPNRLICEVCITRLRDACDFKKQVQDSEKKFVDMIGKGGFRAKDYDENMKSEPQHVQAEPLDVEYLESMDYDDDGDNDEADEDTLGRSSSADITVSSLPAKRGRGRPRKTEQKAVKHKAKDVKTRVTKGTSIMRRRNLQIIFNSTTVIPFKWRGKYRCFYCSKNITEYKDLRQHTKSHGECSIDDHSIKIIKGGHNMEVKIDISELNCNDCSKSFDDFNALIAHLVNEHELVYDDAISSVLEQYNLVDLTCHLCNEKFTYFGYLVSHMNTKHPRNCYICNKCKQKFNKRRDLFSHIKNYHREGGYKCEFCPHVFSTLNILRKHQANRHLTRCPICLIKLPSAALKAKHMATEHPDDESLECHVCRREFHTKQGLKMHSKKCLGDVKREVDYGNDNDDEDSAVKRQSVKRLKQNIVTVVNMSTAVPFSFYKNKFNCFFCSEDFADSDVMREHTITNHPVCDLKSKCIKKCRESNATVKLDVSSLACKVCFESMPDLDTLIEHLTSKHSVDYDKRITTCLQPYRLIKDRIPCPHCPTEVFRFFGTLLKHINSNHTNNNIICVYCGQTFRKEQNLRVHVWRHHKEGQFKCTICNAECGMPSRLYMHMAKVHGVKAAKCSKCGERFATQYLRQKHLIDAHDSGHKCTYCGKLFVRNSFMKDHVRRTHLKEKNVECSVCAMKFFNNILLRRHMVKHSGEKNFHCDVCGERFFWRKGLVRHMGRHAKQIATGAM